jgi:hypothetical protein
VNTEGGDTIDDIEGMKTARMVVEEQIRILRRAAEAIYFSKKDQEIYLRGANDALREVSFVLGIIEGGKR